MRYDTAAVIFVVLSILIWGPTIVPLSFQNKLWATMAAALTSIIVPLMHPALRDD